MCYMSPSVEKWLQGGQQEDNIRFSLAILSKLVLKNRGYGLLKLKGWKWSQDSMIQEYIQHVNTFKFSTGKTNTTSVPHCRTHHKGLKTLGLWQTIQKRQIMNIMMQNSLVYSLEFASPTILSIWRSSLNLSNIVPLPVSCLSCCAPFGTTPQHSITSGCIRLILERQGLPNVVQVKVCPSSKLAERNSPKWFTLPPKPIPFGMLSELKFTAHCKQNNFQHDSD